MVIKQTALFFKEEQIKKLLVLSEKTGAPVAELIRHHPSCSKDVSKENPNAPMAPRRHSFR